MAISPELYTAVKKSFQEAVTDINAREPRLYVTQTNFNRIRKLLFNEGYTDEQMAASSGLFILAFTKLDAKGELELAPVPEPGESQLEAIARRNYELGLKDRSDSSFANQRRARMEEINETPEQRAEKLKKGINNFVQSELNKIKKIETQIERDKDIADNPQNYISQYLPSGYDFSVELSAQEMAAMPLPVLKLYRSRWNEQARKVMTQKWEEKQERIRSKQEESAND
jgi:hypothetical protein